MAINRLPPELLGEIFVEAVSSPITHSNGRSYIIRRSHKWEPLNLVHVCRYWRAVALSMQTLWTSIEADEFKPEALTHWLSFARSSPLHLAYWLGEELEWGQPVDARIVKRTEDMLGQFSLCAERWGSLYFRVEHIELTEALGNMLQAAASRSPLQSLEINMMHEDTPAKIIDTLAVAISSFPSLRYLSWTFNSVQTFLPLPRIFPWQALVDVYVCSSIEVEDLVWCLTQCTSARNVTLLGIGREQERGLTNPLYSIQHTLPVLESLTLNENCDPYWFLQHFTLPSLVSLEIQTAHGPSCRLQDFLVRSQPRLHIFSLYVDCMKKEDIIGCLLTPYLRSVPDVLVMLPLIDAGPFLADIVQRRPNILKELPRLRAWLDRTGNHIGWKKDRGEEVVKH